MEFGINESTKSFKWTYLYYFEIEFKSNLESSKNLFLNQESKLKSIQDVLNKKIEVGLNNVNQEYIGSFYLSHYYFEEKIMNSMLKNHRNFFLLGLFATIESQMKSLCEEVIKRNESISSGKRINSKNGYFKTYFNFLRNTFEIKNSSILENYKFISDRIFIRNAIAHRNGKLKQNELNKIETIVHINYNEQTDELNIESKEFIIELIRRSLLFFIMITIEVDEKWNTHTVANIG